MVCVCVKREREREREIYFGFNNVHNSTLSQGRENANQPKCSLMNKSIKEIWYMYVK